MIALGPEEASRLVDLLAAATDGEEIVLAPGRYALAGTLIARSSVTLRGSTGRAELVAAPNRPILVTEQAGGTVTLLGLDLVGGAGPSGGAVRPQWGSSLVIDGCRFLGNRGERGGALDLTGAAATITRSVFADNVATEGGGALVVGAGGHATVERCAFHANRAKVGGALFVTADGGLRVLGCTFVDDVATWPRGGGALFVLGALSSGASVVLGNCVVRGKEALHADPSKRYEVRFRGSVLPAGTFDVARFEDAGGNSLAEAALVEEGPHLFALAPGTPGAGIADPALTSPGAIDLLGRPFGKAPYAPGALATRG